MSDAVVNVGALNYVLIHHSKLTPISTSTMHAKITIKQILTSNQNWWRFYNANKNKIRKDILVCITKLLSCKHHIRGYHKYRCSNPNCSHVKYIAHTCKCKACSSCGKKSTEKWVQTQNQILPQTSWQHITFTMPSELWDFFWLNRQLLNKIAKIAADCVRSIAKKKGVIIGIFIAIHTFGRNLKRNVHIHLSTTTGGLTQNLQKWKNIFFHQATLMRTWRYQIIKLFRSTKNILIPNSIKQQLHQHFTFNQLLNQLYKKRWIIHCSKPSSEYKQILNYLARYIKRPAIAESKLKHYDGNNVTFKYLDRKNKTFRNLKLSVNQFIAKFIQHIPDIGFRMIRYYGFLANRVRGKLLPIIYFMLGQKTNVLNTPQTFAELMIKNFNIDPFKCILCGNKLILSEIAFGNANIGNLIKHHKQLALLKKI